MTQETIIKILAGMNMVARKSAQTIKTSSASCVEQNILKGKYVLRTEFEQLQKLVQKLQQDISKE